MLGGFRGSYVVSQTCKGGAHCGTATTMPPPLFGAVGLPVFNANRFDLLFHIVKRRKVIGCVGLLHPCKIHHPVARPAPGYVGTVVDGPNHVAVGAIIWIAGILQPSERGSRIYPLNGPARQMPKKDLSLLAIKGLACVKSSVSSASALAVKSA